MAGLGSKMKTWVILHLLLCYLIVASGLIVSILMACTLVVWPFNKNLYRKINSYLAYSWWCHFTFLGQWWSGSECELYIDPSDLPYISNEHALVIMNHKYDIDWLMGWIIIERFGMLGGSKIYGKRNLMYIPILGWIWYLTESIFLKRHWSEDQKTLIHDVQQLTEFPEKYWVTILLFCEGTRFTEEKHKISMEVADQKGLPRLRHHLLPRTKGFVLSLQAMKGKIPVIYDCTVGFRKDAAEPTLMNILNGRTCRAEMHVRRIPVEEIPYEDEEACSVWLHNLYQYKDKIFHEFTIKGRFEGLQKHKVPRRYWDLSIWIGWAVVLCTPLILYTMKIIREGSHLSNLLLLVAAIALTYVATRWSMGLGDIKKGSSYGKMK